MPFSSVVRGLTTAIRNRTGFRVLGLVPFPAFLDSV